MKKAYVLLLVLTCGFYVTANPLPLRTQLSLNGTWTFTPAVGDAGTMIVPDYWDAHPKYEQVDHAIFEREVSVPDSEEWKGKELFLEFDGVNFITEVFVNDKRVGSHIGGWIPFRINITDYVSFGESFTLKVDVKGGNHPPIVDKEGAPLWPVGFIGQKHRWGIVFDVWLRAYGRVSIDDAFIQTSYRKKEIIVDYTITNHSEETKNVNIQSAIVPELDYKAEQLILKSGEEKLKPGETKVVSVKKAWKEPRYWSPADPHLYYLKSEIVEGTGESGTIDSETRRFGFREVWTEGGKLMFNGHPFVIMGANIVQHSEFHLDQRYWYMSPEAWNSSIDRLFELNLRTVRFHMQPAPRYILDIADERGLLVMDESTIYAREYVEEADKEAYLENSKKWIEPWVKARRNHPSVIVWNAENEMGVGWLNWMTPEEIKSLGDEIRKYDTTRPVNYDGDQDVGDDMVNYHYIEEYKKAVEGSVYSWADKVYKDKPTGVGEFITHYGEYGLVNQWWMGTWVRGMRYVGFDDIRPYRHDWAWLSNENTPRTENLKNGFSPVALFDKEYDDLGIDPLLYENYPVLMAGDTANRTLVLYNDAFEDTVISIEVVIRSSWVNEALTWYNGATAESREIIAQGRKTFVVPLGEHVDIPYSFEVPALRQGIVDRIEVELIARKKGELKFKEVRVFALRGREFSEDTSPEVLIGEAEESEY